MFNSVVLVGRIGRNIELKKSKDDKSYCRLALATNSGYGDKKRTDWHDVTVFGNQAENCCKFLEKGSIVCVQGRIQYDSYEKDGHKIRTTSIIADEVTFLSTKSETAQKNEQPQIQPQINVPQAMIPQQPIPVDPTIDVFGAGTNDDIPF